MTERSFLVVPDGALLDHFAEFAYAPADRQRRLFAVDEGGYADALANLVQIISVGGNIGVSGRQSSTSPTDQLKADLKNYGLLMTVNYFDQTHEKQRLSDANSELQKYWGKSAENLRILHQRQALLSSATYVGSSITFGFARTPSLQRSGTPTQRMLSHCRRGFESAHCAM